MDDATRSQLQRVWNAAEYMAGLENQDRDMVVEMTQDMLADVIETGRLRPTADYVGRYCDVIDGPDDVDAHAVAIDAMET